MSINKKQKAPINNFPGKIFFVGIGGSGVSGLARILHAEGHQISGSDLNTGRSVEKLKHDGIEIKIGHTAENLPKDSGLLVYSPAITIANPERKKAAQMEITQMSYPEALGLYTRKKDTIAICGTHGKTTTTSVAAMALINGEMDPTVLVGATLKELNGYNCRLGEGDYFVLEACEYKRAFLNYHPSVIIVTNVEADHLDYYRDIDDYRLAFSQFLGNLKQGGLVIANIDDSNVRKVLSSLEHKPNLLTYGKSQDADFRLQEKTVFFHDKKIAELSLNIPGEHNLMNATAVICLSHHLKLDIPKVVKALNGFSGAERRFEIKGHLGKTLIIDDYAHHPTEIKATLEALRHKYGKDKKVLCVFQPHQYNRTLNLLDDFATAFQSADKIIIPNIFKVRDSVADLKKVNEQILVDKISQNHPDAIYGGGLEKTREYILENSARFDIVITLGAGDIYKLADSLIKN